MSFANELKTHFATKSELRELEQITKAMATTDTADVMITIDYDKELQKSVYHTSPFLSYLEQNGVVSPASVAKVGYRVKKQNTTSSFINEGAEIPAHDPSQFTDEVVKMKTLVYPIEVSDLAQLGVDSVDIMEDEITDGFLDMAVAKDKAIMQGQGTSDTKDFIGLNPGIKTHKTNMNNSVISKDAIDILAQELIDDGGSPSAVLTTAKVGRQLNDILYPSVRNVDKVELALGTRVTAYNAPNGVSIPIIVDPNLDTTNGDTLTILDNSSLRVREFVPPTIAELAKTKLSTSRVLYTYFTFYDRAEYRNGIITGIGDNEA